MLCVRFTVVCCAVVFFFFQAEDGIRDLTVTGVQTCALPICRDRVAGREAEPQVVSLVPPRPESRPRPVPRGRGRSLPRRGLRGAGRRRRSLDRKSVV